MAEGFIAGESVSIDSTHIESLDFNNVKNSKDNLQQELNLESSDESLQPCQLEPKKAWS